MPKAIAYRVEDRSILIPYYKRYIIDPLVAYIPAKLHPNSITHLGHALNLIGAATLLALWPQKGWPFAFAAFTLHAYNWCDNADGAHARRTKQASAIGEFLDHGLDQFNMVYMAFISAMALGVSPGWWVAFALLMPGAGCLAYLEQTQTGVLRMGLLNQVESIVVLSSLLVVSALFGTVAFERFAFHGLSARFFFCVWSISTILFGIGRGMLRIAAHGGMRDVAPALPFLLACASVFCAWQTKTISTINAVTLATCINVYFGMRMLSRRMCEKPAKVEPLLVLFGLALGGCVLWHQSGRALAEGTGTGVAVMACVAFGAETLRAARAGVVHLLTTNA